MHTSGTLLLLESPATDHITSWGHKEEIEPRHVDSQALQGDSRGLSISCASAAKLTGFFGDIRRVVTVDKDAIRGDVIQIARCNTQKIPGPLGV
jgi:hypothetical protein